MDNRLSDATRLALKPMITITSSELYALLASFLWPLTRILALFSVAPVFNQPMPAQIKIGLAVAIALIVAPLAGPLPVIDPWSAAGLLVLVQQIVIGVAMGLAMRVVFSAIDMAGEIAGLQMGLGFASFFDPLNATTTPVVAQFLGLLATLVFLAVNGHLLLLSTLVESFQTIPLAAGPLAAPAWLTLADWGGKIFQAGLMLALPIVGALLIANLALGVLTRAAPQLNIFAVGFPVTLLLGLVVLALGMPHFGPAVTRLFDEGLGMLLPLTGQMRP